jgi:hypothetical protein
MTNFYNVVHILISLVQLFVLLLQYFEELVQIIELKMFEGTPNGYLFAPLTLRSHIADFIINSCLIFLISVFTFNVMCESRGSSIVLSIFITLKPCNCSPQGDVRVCSRPLLHSKSVKVPKICNTRSREVKSK